MTTDRGREFLPRNEDGGPAGPLSRRSLDLAALLIAAGLAAIAILITVQTMAMPASAGYARIGPQTFPYIIAFCLFGLSAWTAVAAFRGDFPEREEQHFSPMAWIVGGLAAQMLLLNIAGFSIATGLLFAATARAFGYRQLWKSLPIGIVLCFFVWVAFSQGLNLSLPAGPLEQMFF